MQQMEFQTTLFAARVAALAGFAFIAASAQSQSQSQGAPALAATPLQFNAYIDAVERESLDLQAQQQTIVAARAGVGIAGIRPDPSISYGATRELVRSGSPRPIGHGPSIGFTIETAGKRAARIKAAESNVTLALANLEGFKHGVYNTSATAFAEACRTREVAARKEQTLTALTEVVRVNEIRRKAGDVGGIELLQSRVERDQFQAEVLKARADANAAIVSLGVPLSRKLAEVFPGAALECRFDEFHQGEDVEALVPEAMRSRDDVEIARSTLANARDNVSVARASRWVDPTVSVGVTAVRGYLERFDAEGNVAADATPRSRVLGVSVSIPIPLSRLDRGDLVQAESAVTQAMLGLRQAELKSEADVRVAHQQFMAARENLRRYRESMLADAERVLEGIRLSYRNGAASLLELLAAQRSADDAYQAFLQAQADLATATVQLQLAIGRRPAL